MMYSRLEKSDDLTKKLSIIVENEICTDPKLMFKINKAISPKLSAKNVHLYDWF